VHATIENLSASGALIVAHHCGDAAYAICDVELKLGLDSGSVLARPVRVIHAAEVTRIAVEFCRIEPEFQAAIEVAVEDAMIAAARRPVLVVDDQPLRRHALVSRLRARGLKPLAPRTPLEALDLLTRSHLHINVALLAAGFGQSAAELRAVIVDSFPWVTTADISNDVEATVDVADAAWSEHVRLATAIS
jgi:hypothetical protein